MSSVITPPQEPTTGQEVKLQTWLTTVEDFLTQVEEWAHKRNWTTRREDKEIAEREFGVYEVPVLLINTPEGRLLVDPAERHAYEADGRIEFGKMPSIDSKFHIVLLAGQWRLFYRNRNKPDRVWNEETFESAATELLA